MVAVLAVGFGLGVATLASPAAQRRLADTLTLPAFLGGQTAAGGELRHGARPADRRRAVGGGRRAALAAVRLGGARR